VGNSAALLYVVFPPLFPQHPQKTHLQTSRYYTNPHPSHRTQSATSTSPAPAAVPQTPSAPVQQPATTTSPPTAPLHLRISHRKNNAVPPASPTVAILAPAGWDVMRTTQLPPLYPLLPPYHASARPPRRICSLAYYLQPYCARVGR